MNMSPKFPEEAREMEGVPYRETVGTLLWLSLGTRPDICYEVCPVAKFKDCFHVLLLLKRERERERERERGDI